MVGNDDEIDFEGKKYKSSNLTDAAKNIIRNLSYVNAVSSEKASMIAILTKAKKAYIADLKSEMLKAKSGFDFSE